MLILAKKHSGFIAERDKDWYIDARTRTLHLSKNEHWNFQKNGATELIKERTHNVG